MPTNSISVFSSCLLLLLSSATTSTINASPQFVQTCLDAASTWDGLNLIQVNCTSLSDRAEYLINNSSGTTIIQNCQFNGCGNIKAKSPVQFKNVFFNSSTYGGSTAFNQGGAGGAVSLDGANGYFENVTITNCKAQ